MIGSVLAGLVLAALCVRLKLRQWREVRQADPAVWAEKAQRMAEEAGLPLPPDLTGWLGARLRSRQRAALAVNGLVSPLLIFLTGYVLCYSIFVNSTIRPEFGTAAVLWAWIILGAITESARYLRDMRDVRQGREVTKPASTARALGDFLPPDLTVAIRFIVILPMAATVIVAVGSAGTQSRLWPFAIVAIGSSKAQPRLWPFAVVAVAALVAIASAELVQQRVIAGPRLGPTDAARALGDALRARVLLAAAAFPLAVMAIGMTLASWPLVRQHGYWPLEPLVVAATSVTGMVYLNISVRPWARLHFRKRLPPAEQA